MVSFSPEQVLELEDRLLNMVFPVYMKLQTIEAGKEISRRDVKMMLNRIDEMVKYIRGLRPEHKRSNPYRRNRR